MHDISPKAVIDLVQTERLTLLDKFNNKEVEKISTNHLILLSDLANTALAQEKNQIDNESNNTNKAILDVVGKVLSGSSNPFLGDGVNQSQISKDLELPEIDIIDGQQSTELINYSYSDGEISQVEE